MKNRIEKQHNKIPNLILAVITLHSLQLGRLLCFENRTPSFSTMRDVRDVGIVSGNVLRTRKYRFVLCCRVLSNLYVERSAYANVFRFNRGKKLSERAKVNSRCFHWFPAAMFILNTIIFRDILCQITRVPNIVHPENFGTLFIYYSSTIFEFPDLIYWMVSDFNSIFHLRDNQAYLRDVKTANSCLLKLYCLNDILLAISDELKLIVPKFALPLYCLFLLSCFLACVGFFRFKTIPINNHGQSWTKVFTHFSKTNALT